MAITEVYVDSAAAGSNDGTSLANAYTSLQAGLNARTAGGTGHRFNIKGTQVLTAAIDLTTYGNPTAAAPLVFQGISSSPGDDPYGASGGGTITGVANSVAILADATRDFITFADLTLIGGQASGYAVQSDDDFTLIRCIITSPYDGVDADNRLTIIGCKVTWGNSGTSIGVGALGGLAYGNYLVAGANAGGASGLGFADAGGAGIACIANIIDATAAGATFNSAIISQHAINNTVIASGSDAYAIGQNSSSCVFINNYVQGFSGTGGIAINPQASSCFAFIAGNRWFNCDTGITVGTEVSIQADNSVTSASGITGSYYEPTSELIEAGWPSDFYSLEDGANDPDIGAVQKAAVAGGAAFPRIQLDGVLG